MMSLSCILISYCSEVTDFYYLTSPQDLSEDQDMTSEHDSYVAWLEISALYSLADISAAFVDFLLFSQSYWIIHLST